MGANGYHQGRLGYDRDVHVDHARRLISMLIYMCDHTENQMNGGELFLHAGGKRQSDPPIRITPRHNLMVAFPCTCRSHHSVSPIKSMAVPRNYIQVHISSSVDIWPREATPGIWRRKLRSLKRRFNAKSLQGSVTR
ncbi:MAG: 2OG-Fe(II) oxygenase [Pyrinomonadaceae bacterium]